MQELLDQLITPEVRMVLYLMVVCVVMLYVLSIVYVIRDAQRRGEVRFCKVEFQLRRSVEPGCHRLLDGRA